MSEDLRTENSVRIEVPVEKVWEALTTAEMMKQWSESRRLDQASRTAGVRTPD